MYHSLADRVVGSTEMMDVLHGVEKPRIEPRYDDLNMRAHTRFRQTLRNPKPYTVGPLIIQSLWAKK